MVFGAAIFFIWCGNGVPTPLFLALHPWWKISCFHICYDDRLALNSDKICLKNSSEQLLFARGYRRVFFCLVEKDGASAPKLSYTIA